MFNKTNKGESSMARRKNSFTLQCDYFTVLEAKEFLTNKGWSFIEEKENSYKFFKENSRYIIELELFGFSPWESDGIILSVFKDNKQKCFKHNIEDFVSKPSTTKNIIKTLRHYAQL